MLARDNSPLPFTNIWSLHWTEYLAIFLSVNHNSIYENSLLKNVKNIKFLDQISNNSPNDLLGTNVRVDSWILLGIVVENITMD